MATKFFQMIQKGKINEAYNQVFIGSIMSTEKPQQLEMVKNQTQAISMYGGIIDFEKISEESIGSSIIRLVYVLKSEKHPTIWELYFYKPKSEWILSQIMFNDQFQKLNKS